jgi:dihydropteroate synthase
MIIFGVINASPDSLHRGSIVRTADEATARARQLLSSGADALDIGGQGSTDNATVVNWTIEWERMEPVIEAVRELHVPVSVDSWRPQVVRRALLAGATVINAADGMQTEEMWQIAAEFDVPIVVPFLSGPNPREMSPVRDDPIGEICSFFAARLADAERYGLRHRCMLDPGTGFAPSSWPWEERYRYQRHVYANLSTLRRFDLPLYVALPWKLTAQHDELLDLVLRARPEYGRAHDPRRVRAAQRRVGELRVDRRAAVARDR